MKLKITLYIFLIFILNFVFQSTICMRLFNNNNAYAADNKNPSAYFDLNFSDNIFRNFPFFYYNNLNKNSPLQNEYLALKNSDILSQPFLILNNDEAQEKNNMFKPDLIDESLNKKIHKKQNYKHKLKGKLKKFLFFFKTIYRFTKK